MAPETRIGDVPDLPRMVTRAQLLLDQNRHRAVPSTTGELARGRTLWVYRRAGEPCRRCGTTIRETVLGPEGQERATFACPACQPRR